jgi:ubiquinone/menaquinone biosynthesis C-methylase UbiE
MKPPLDPAQLAAQAQFDRQSANYGRGHILANIDDVARLHELCLSQSPLAAKKPWRALDIASGAGHTGLYLAEQGHQVTLSDLAPGMLAQCRLAASERGLTVSLAQHSAEDLPYPDNSFELVTCRVAAHHFSSPPTFLSEVERVLSPNGFLLLIDGTVPDSHPIAEAWIHAVEIRRDPSHQRFISPSTWRILCKHAGLDVCHLETHPLVQPDLEWYLQTANTSADNREAVYCLLNNAPQSARTVFEITSKQGTIAWQWPRLQLLARKAVK